MTRDEKQKILGELGGLSEDVYDGLVRDLVALIEEYLPKIQEKLSEGNLEDMAGIAHTIKGSSANLRLASLREIAQQLEFGAKEEKDKSYLEDLLKKMEAALDDLKQVF